MKRILEDIRTKNFSQVYVLYGREDYLRKQYRDRLVEALTEDGDSMNYTFMRGKNCNLAGLIDLAETMPFLSERRVIVLEDTGVLKSGGEELAAYFQAPCPTTVWVLVDSECDKRSRLFKAADTFGRCVEFASQDEATLKKWVLSLIRKEKKQISARTLDEFLERAGDDMSTIRLELEKVFCYTLDRDCITMEDVEAVCLPRITGRIFDMVDAIGARDRTKALKLYNDLQFLREPPTRILYLIGRQMNLLLQTKELRAQGMDSRAIAAKLGIPGFAAGKYIRQASDYSTEQLKRALSGCIEADEAIKTGKTTDKFSVELLIMELTA
ncbi:MAG: DNA polymerase III subunit delta [Lachnospiraceae bacterium]|nr:DNA polymerase III subunit delta [Lachnospiraceae bacterium]